MDLPTADKEQSAAFIVSFLSLSLDGCRIFARFRRSTLDAVCHVPCFGSRGIERACRVHAEAKAEAWLRCMDLRSLSRKHATSLLLRPSIAASPLGTQSASRARPSQGLQTVFRCEAGHITESLRIVTDLYLPR